MSGYKRELIQWNQLDRVNQMNVIALRYLVERGPSLWNELINDFNKARGKR